MNRAARRQAAKEFQAQLKDQSLAGAVDLSQPRTRSVYLGYPVRGYVRVEFMRSILRAAAGGRAAGFTIRPVDVEYDQERPRALNGLLQNFLTTEDEYLLLADSNIAFAPQDVAVLLAADAAIAGALYFSAASGTEPWPTAWVERMLDESREEEDGLSTFHSGDFEPVSLPTPPEDFDENDEEKVTEWLAVLTNPIPVAGVGIGLLLIRRDAAAKIAEVFPHPFEFVKDRREELTFGLRAASVGFESVLVPAARVGNLQGVVL